MLQLKTKTKTNNTCRYYQNLNDMVYSSWGIEQNKLKLVILGHFLRVFCSFFDWRYYHFTQVYHKWQSWCMVPEIWSVKDIFFCHFGLFFLFAIYPSNNPKNQNFEKLKKTPGEIIILQKCTKNHDYMLWQM